MGQRGALDDGFSSMSRREIRALRREFAKLDRLGAREHEPLDYVPRQGSPSGTSKRPPDARDAATPDGLAGSPMSVDEALRRIRWSVVLLLLVGVLMTVATVLPSGWNRTDSVPPAPNPSTAPAAPLDSAHPTVGTQPPPSRFGAPEPSEAPSTPTFTFQGPFGP